MTAFVSQSPSLPFLPESTVKIKANLQLSKHIYWYRLDLCNRGFVTYLKHNYILLNYEIEYTLVLQGGGVDRVATCPLHQFFYAKQHPPLLTPAPASIILNLLRLATFLIKVVEQRLPAQCVLACVQNTNMLVLHVSTLNEDITVAT